MQAPYCICGAAMACRVVDLASRRLVTATVVTAVVTAICILVIDAPLARALSAYEPSPLWDRTLDALEFLLLLPLWKWASVAVLVAATVAAYALRRTAAPAWLFVTGTHALARVTMGPIKEGLGRLRPHEWHGGPTFFLGGVSFPSGHVVLFASVLIPLAIVAPRTRPLLAIVGFVMVARIAVHAHFAADVVSGLTLVTVVALACWATIRRLPASR